MDGELTIGIALVGVLVLGAVIFSTKLPKAARIMAAIVGVLLIISPLIYLFLFWLAWKDV